MGKAGCAINGCRPSKHSRRVRFPNPEKYSATFLMWKQFLGRFILLHCSNMEIYYRYHVCDKHFYPEDFSPSSRRLLKKGVIPSRFLPGSFEQVPEDLDTPDFENMSQSDSEWPQEVLETVHLAETYFEKLTELKTQLEQLELQVTSTFQSTRHSIQASFSDLKSFVLNALEEREKELICKAELIKEEGLKPLVSCKRIIDANIETTSNLISEGSKIQINDTDKVHKFLDKATHLGNLPALPSFKSVPCICFYCEPIIKKDIGYYCSNFGEVFSTAPIQIDSVDSKPGSLLVKWDKSVENEQTNLEVAEYKLERAFGDVTKNQNTPVNFIDCYKGPETQFLLRDIQIAQPYTFRVCCKFSGAAEWTPYSFPHVGLTMIPPLSWKPTDGLILLNDNKIVSVAVDMEKSGVVARSAEKLFIDNSEENCVEFTVIEADLTSPLLLGLSLADGANMDKNIMENAFLIDNEGKIFVNGSEKRTVLPKLTRGTKICFFNSLREDDKLKVTVDCKDKSVTYYWDSDHITNLNFVCYLKSSKWKIMVE